MVADAPSPENHAATSAESLARQVRSAVIWRSGSQILAQGVQWAATFLVIRQLAPADYGLFAMTQVVMSFAAMLNGYGLASALVRQKEVSDRLVRQLFGMLLLLNGGLAVVQFGAAGAIAAYYRQPIVADLLRMQALMYVTTPFIALPAALLSRRMDFRVQASVNMVAALLAAVTALLGAYGGLGVWTLVAAPFVLFATRAIGMTAAARTLLAPSFDFRGAGDLARYGGLMAASQLFWFVQSQTDVLIAGRHVAPHALGIYTTALFLTQIFVAKVVPPLNEVAFSAYARIQDDSVARAAAFLKAVRIVSVVALPFYAGLAVAAEPLVLTVLGAKWVATVPLVRLLACAMPPMTLLVLYGPVTDALGRPGVAVGTGAIGAAILLLAFLLGIRWGTTGLAVAWCAAYPLYLAVASRRALPVIGVSGAGVGAALVRPLAAAAAMAAGVAALDRLVGTVEAPLRLALLVAAGVLLYGAALALWARPLLGELLALARGRAG